MTDKLNTYQDNSVWTKLMTRLYPRLSTRMAFFVILFGLSQLSFGLVMVYEYFGLISHYQSIHLTWLLNDLYRQLTFFFLFILGALLFLRVNWLGWMILTGLFISIAFKGAVMLSGRNIYKLLSPGMGGLHDEINPSFQAGGIVLLVLMVVLTIIMHLKVIRKAFNLSKKQVWSGIVAAGLLISVDLGTKWFFDLGRSIL